MAFAAFAIEPGFQRAKLEGGEWWRQKNQLDKKNRKSEYAARVERTGSQLKRGEVNLTSGARCGFHEKKIHRSHSDLHVSVHFLCAIAADLLEQVLIMRYHCRWISNTAKK